MALAQRSMQSVRCSSAAPRFGVAMAPLTKRRSLPVVRSNMIDLIAAAGDVEAPTSVLIGGAILVTLAATALVPLALNPGQKAADQIFDGKQNKPLDKKSAKKTPPTKRR